MISVLSEATLPAGSPLDADVPPNAPRTTGVRVWTAVLTDEGQLHLLLDHPAGFSDRGLGLYSLLRARNVFGPIRGGTIALIRDGTRIEDDTTSVVAFDWRVRPVIHDTPDWTTCP